MMVIQGTVPSNTFGTHAATVRFVLPADRCSWTQADTTGGGYEVDNVFFQRGNQNQVAVGDALLGQIGKSGRFVAFTN